METLDSVCFLGAENKGTYPFFVITVYFILKLVQKLIHIKKASRNQTCLLSKNTKIRLKSAANDDSSYGVVDAVVDIYSFDNRYQNLVAARFLLIKFLKCVRYVLS